MFEKLQTGEKIHDAPANLQPSDLRSNAYRSLPGDQDIFSLFFSYIYIHRNPRKWLIILKYFLWNLMDIVLFIKTLKHKCWRSIGHQILQPTKDRAVFLSPKLGPCTYKAFLSSICLQPAVNTRGEMKATTAVGASEESKNVCQSISSLNSVTSIINGIFIDLYD